MTRNWALIYLLLITVGWAATWGLTNTGEVTSTFPAWARVLWFGGLALGSLATIIGELVFTNWSLIVARVALVFLTGWISAYTLAFVLVGIRVSTFDHVVVVALFLLLFAALNYNRARQIGQQLKSLYYVYERLPRAS